MAFLPVPAGTTFSYNGFTWPSTANTRIRARAIPDKAGRVTAYTTFEITVRWMLHAGSAESYDAGTQIETLRRQLKQRAGILRIQGKGFGTFTVNDTTGPKDIDYGPIPDDLECIPVSPGASWMLTWRCRTSFPDECTGASYQNRPVMYGYEVDNRRDEHGFTTRTINGELVIPANRIAGSQQISDAADRYWDQTIAGIPPIPGFRRMMAHGMDMSKRVLKFQIIDTELPPHGFQVGCTDWDGRHRCETGLKSGGLMNGTANISATFRVARDQPKVLAYYRFGDLVLARITAGLPFVQRDASGPVLFPLEYSVDEHISGQDVSCSLTYFVGAQSPDKFLAACGLFGPVPSSDWTAYWSSIQRSAGNPRGNAQLFYDRTSDAIVSLCEGTTASMRSGGQVSGPGSETILKGFFPPKNSYAKLTASIQITGESEMVAHKPMVRELRTADLRQGGNLAEMRSVGSLPSWTGLGGNVGGGAFYSESSFADEIIQVPASPSLHAVLRVQAVRLGYPLPDFGLLALGGVATILERPSCIKGWRATPGGPLFWGDYEHVYRLPAVPRGPVVGPPTIR